MRSGYGECNDYPGQLELYRGNVDRAIAGRRGQQLLRDALAALDAMPEKRLVAEVLVDGSDVCLLGAVIRRRGVASDDDMEHIDAEDHRRLGALLDAPRCLIREVEYMNDEATYLPESPEQRWARVRRWVAESLTPAAGQPVQTL